MNVKTSRLLFVSLLVLSGLFSLYYITTVEESGEGEQVDMFLSYKYILFAVCILATLGFSVAQMITNFKAAIVSLASIVALVVIYFISFNISSDEVLKSYEAYEITSTVSQNVGSYLRMVYVLGFLAVGAIVFDFVRAIVK